MSFQHALQASRFELKYIISEQCAHGIRDFVSNHLEADEHARPGPDPSYPVNSLYLDTPSLLLFGQTVEGIKNRFKLRIRFYDGKPDAPAFLEIKRRVTDVICKERAAISREGVERLLDGKWPGPEYLMGKNGNPVASSALHNFCNLCQTINAGPCVYVCYMREAYVSPNSNQVRVTFDRGLFGSRFDRQTCLIPPKDGGRPEIGGVVLELKFTDRFPPWMKDLVQAFNLQRCSMPKYIKCISKLGIQPGQVLC